MTSTISDIKKTLDIFYRNTSPEVKKLEVGDTVAITSYIELPDETVADKKGKGRIQKYSGVIISKHNQSSDSDSTITVRKTFQGLGIEKVFVVNSPWVKEIEIISKAIVRRSKLYYLRERTGKATRLKRRI